jgi:hypothetical protein
MKITTKMLATSMIAAAGATAVALGLSATAAAEPAAPVPMPSVPGLPFLQQLATNPAAATSLMQGFTSLLGTAQTAAAPAAAAPAATASVTLPQPPAAVPGAAAPLNTLATTTAPAVAPQNLLPLPQGLSVPSALASLMPAGTPLAGLLPTAATAPAATAAPAAAAPAAAPSAPLAPMLMPLSALP